MDGLIINVYRNADGSDCTNGGISSKHNDLTLIGKGISGPFEPTPDRPAVTIIENVPGNFCIVPCDENAKPLPGWFMFGGNFGSTSDSRFPFRMAVKIHDRQEPYSNNFD